jgi:NAD(P)-dependent dehydrogenase (short-subunit alcohol dehydrogenase family)
MDKTIIVTGASRGLGAAAAQQAAQLGANVVLNARSESDLADIVQVIEAEGGSAAVVAGDVSDLATARRMVTKAVEQYGRLDGVINNAGVLGPIELVAEAEPDGWMRNWAINLFGPLMLVKEALSQLRAQGGRVINVSSGAAVRAYHGCGAYSIAKAGLNQFTRVIAVEEAAVTAVAVRPGVVDTAMQREVREEGREAMLADDYARSVHYHEEGNLLPPEKPGRALALMALYAPTEWSGEFMEWDDPRVARLAREYTG